MEELEKLKETVEALEEDLKLHTNALQAQILDVRIELATLEEKISELSWRVSALEEVD